MKSPARLATVVLCAGGCLLVAPVLALEGRWQGTLNAGPADLRLVLEVTMTQDHLYLGTLTSIDQGNAVLPIDVISVEGERVRFEIRTVGALYEGALDAERSRLAGTWTQGSRLPLEFQRTATAEATRAARSGPPARERGQEPDADPFGLPLHVDVSGPAEPFAAGGAVHLAYELHLTNFGASDLAIRRIEVLGPAARGEPTPIAVLEGAELNAVLRPVGAPPRGAAPGGPITDLREIPAGRRAVAFLWTTFSDRSAVPDALLHRVTAGGQTVEGPRTAVRPDPPLVLGPPLRGTGWMAVNGPGNSSIHRRALVPSAGRASIAQRFAIDWVRLDENGSAFAGDAEDNSAYYAYGQEVLAVGNAVVADILDGVPENVPGLTSRAVAMTRETIVGNYVVLDLGGDRYAFYAHLRPGSLRVAVGERVRRGDVIALVGNSGNSTEPHLHFHLADGSSALSSEGVPYVIEAFEVVEPDGSVRPRRNELPMQNALVRFPDRP